MTGRKSILATFIKLACGGLHQIDQTIQCGFVAWSQSLGQWLKNSGGQLICNQNGDRDTTKGEPCLLIIFFEQDKNEPQIKWNPKFEISGSEHEAIKFWMAQPI